VDTGFLVRWALRAKSNILLLLAAAAAAEITTKQPVVVAAGLEPLDHLPLLVFPPT
jgi:hypothetical protein